MEPMHQLARTTTEGLKRDALAFSALPDAPIRQPRRSRLGVAASAAGRFLARLAGTVRSAGGAAAGPARQRSRARRADRSYQPRPG